MPLRRTSGLFEPLEFPIWPLGLWQTPKVLPFLFVQKWPLVWAKQVSSQLGNSRLSLGALVPCLVVSAAL